MPSLEHVALLFDESPVHLRSHPESTVALMGVTGDRPHGESDGVINPMRFASGGIEFALTCLAGALAGQWIDGRLHTAPWFTVILLVVAFASGTWMLLRSLSVVGSDKSDAE